MNCFDDAVQFWQKLRLHLLQRGLNQDFEIVEHQSKIETRYTFHTSETLVPKRWTISMIFFPENGTFFFPELPSAFRSSGFQSTFLLSRDWGSSKHNNQSLATTICWVKVVRDWILVSFFLSFQLGFPQNGNTQDIFYRQVLSQQIWLLDKMLQNSSLFFTRSSNVWWAWMLNVMHINGASM